MNENKIEESGRRGKREEQINEEGNKTHRNKT